MRFHPLLPLSRRRVRTVLGALWLLDAVLQAQPQMFSADWWRSNLAGSAMGQPYFIRQSIVWVVAIVARHPAIWNTAFVSIQLAVGVALLAGRLERSAIVVSVPWALGVWWVGEGLGMLPTGFATLATGAPGAVLLYPLIGLLAWPGSLRSPKSGPVATAPAAGSWMTLWAGLSLLQLPLLYPAGQVLRANAQELSDGHPGWLAGVAAGHAAAFFAMLAVVQVAVGVGVLWRRTRGPAVFAGVVLAAAYWLFFQYLGGMVAGGSTDPSSGPLLALLGLALWPAGQRLWSSRSSRYRMRWTPRRAVSTLSESEVMARS